jgi:hypothetical protein
MALVLTQIDQGGLGLLHEPPVRFGGPAPSVRVRCSLAPVFPAAMAATT